MGSMRIIVECAFRNVKKLFIHCYFSHNNLTVKVPLVKSFVVSLLLSTFRACMYSLESSRYF